MKKLISIIIPVIIAVILVACTKAPEPTFTGEKKSYTEKINGDGTVDKRWYYKYYTTGEVSTALCCTENGTCVQRNEYTYNDDLLKESETIFLNGKKSFYTEFSYTDDLKILTEKFHSPTSVTTTTYYYNPDGTEDYVETRDETDKLVSVKRCIYDDSGNKIKERFFNGYEQYTGGIEYTYDGSTLIMKEYVGTASSEFSKEEYTYENDKIVKTLLYDKSGALIYIETEDFEGDEIVCKTRYNPDNTVIYTWNVYFDSFITLIG